MKVTEFNKLLMSDNKADREILCEYCLRMIRIRLRYRVKEQEEERVAHEIIEKFLKYAKAPILNPKAYITRCVNNHLATYYGKQEKPLKLNENLGYEVTYPQLETEDIMKFVIQTVGEDNAMLIYMNSVQGYNCLQIAKITGIKYHNVRQRICRSKKKLKEEFKNFNKDVTKD